MKYLEITIKMSAFEPYRDLLVSDLGDGAFDSFELTSDGVNAYVPQENFDESFLNECIQNVQQLCITTGHTPLQCSYSVKELADKNYNEEWESKHEAVLVGDFCWVRAPFHPHRNDVKYEIEIEPKMSFGTAHHATTYLMLSFLERETTANRRVLDMGCGTGVLAILAAMKGASYVEAIDVDEWAFRNAQENFERNGVEVNLFQGDASLLTGEKHFDLILANINRNILLRDMAAYRAVLDNGGTLLMSGFYEHDVEAITKKAESLGLVFVEMNVRDEWAAVKVTATRQAS